ncbi:MAG TPA: hypothetical protein VNO51_04760 [Ilumatobacteraceae bacterium]|nr:hypothetical protein [Ilumatobacteraceae bacterium]
MKQLRRLLVSSAIIALPFAVGSTASAGGWAISTLDEVPAAAPDETVSVGFTIRQHGVTPVNLEDVGVEVTAPSGAIEVFPATQEGAVGHYVADVVFGEVGVHSWAIRQGWFADHELGTIDTSRVAGGAGGSSGTSWSTQFLRFGLPTLALALGGYAAIDALGTRRRRRVTVRDVAA